MCTFAYTQYAPSVCSDGQGGAFIAWRDLRDNPISEEDIYLQHLTSDGFIAPGWPADGLPVGVTPFTQAGHELVPDGEGGVIIAWLSAKSDGFDVYALRFASDGTIVPGWPDTGLAVAVVPSSQDFMMACTDGAGGAYLAWVDYRDGYVNRKIYAQHITASGDIALGWPVNGKTVSTAPPPDEFPLIVPDGGGRAIVVLARSDGIFAQRLNADGSVVPGWPTEGVPVNTLPTCKGSLAVAPDGTGGAFFGWDETREVPPEDPCYPGYADAYCQHLTASGAIAPGWPVNGLPVCTLPRDQRTVRVSEDGAGGVFLVWDDYRDYFPSASDLYLQRLLPTGVTAPGWPANGRPVSTASGFQFAGLIVPDGMGGAFVAFESIDFASTYGYRAYAHHVAGNGEFASGWPQDGVSLASPPQDQTDVVIVAVGAGNAIVAWTDQRTNSQGDIYAQKLVGDGPVPVQLSLVSAEAHPDRAVLTWFAPGAASLVATVYRRTELSDWVPLGSPSRDGSDRLVFEDRTVVPGSRYAYRLGYREGQGEVFTAETWLEIPTAYALSLEGFRPNPAVSDLTVAFSLPSADPASLELLDLAGRRVLVQEVGSLGPGRHVLRLGDGASVRTGLYWLRLRQAAQTLVTRGAVIR